MSAYERAASAIATAMTELEEHGLTPTDGMTAVLLKHFLVHFADLQREFEQLLEPVDLDDHLRQTAAHQPYS